ncbi:hypothetical protein BMS3Bbin02_02046 [bacterium BMS3Bbin02]|nr:hypothetical protein BMS3Bbin02_02046 [bacterium BMS3Bbin02]
MSGEFDMSPNQRTSKHERVESGSERTPMRKALILSAVAALFLSIALPVRAAQEEEWQYGSGTYTVTGAPQERS